MSAQTPAKITLEEITQRKKKLLNEIHAQKRAIDGVVMGIKIMKKIRAYFRKLR